jgi:hypothetical protein
MFDALATVPKLDRGFDSKVLAKYITVLMFATLYALKMCLGGKMKCGNE